MFRVIEMLKLTSLHRIGLLTYANKCVSQVERIEISIRRGLINLQFYLGSRYKTNCDFETAIPHYIDGFATRPNGIYFLPTSRQYNVVLPSQNHNLFILTHFGNHIGTVHKFSKFR